MPLIVAQATLLFGYAMVDFAAISFIGLGVQPPTADWGVMVASGQAGVLQGYPLESLTAGLCIVVVVVAVNLLGERLAADSEATMSDDLHYLSATEALARFRDRSLSPVELLDAVIARAEAVEPTVNALCHERYEAAREEARAAEARWAGRGDGEPRALEGIPLAIKEEEEVAGQPWTQGSLIYKDLVAEQSSAFAQRHARRRRDRPRPHDRARVLLRAVHPLAPARRDAQPVEPGVRRRRLVRRVGRRAGRRGRRRSRAAPTSAARSARPPPSTASSASSRRTAGWPRRCRSTSTPTATAARSPARSPTRRCTRTCWPGPDPSDIVSLRPKVVLPDTFDGVEGLRIAVSVDLDGSWPIDPEIRRNTLDCADALRARARSSTRSRSTCRTTS